MLHNARETMLEITVTGWETGRVGVRFRGSRIILLSSSFNPLSIIKKSVCVSRESNWHSQRTCALLTLFYNHDHHHIAAWVQFIHVSSQRRGHWHWGWQRVVNALKKNPIQRHSANNYTSMSHFNGFHFMPYLGRRPSCSGQDILPFSLVFLSNDLMTVRTW